MLFSREKKRERERERETLRSLFVAKNIINETFEMHCALPTDCLNPRNQSVCIWGGGDGGGGGGGGE